MKKQKSLAGIALALLLAAFFQGRQNFGSSSEQRKGLQDSPQDRSSIPPVTQSDRVSVHTPSTRKRREKKPQSIRVQVTFVEINSEDTEELGFDWAVSPLGEIQFK